jgi:hypothetical protein
MGDGEIGDSVRYTILANAKKIFFKALLAGYVGNKKNVRKEQRPNGEKIITWISPDGIWKVVDRYVTTRGSKWSAGSTTIFYRGEAVWWMSYGGWYEKRTIPFLKKALARAYTTRIWNGGRGCRFFSDVSHPGVIYSNTTSPVNNDFTNFSGEEQITLENGSEILGYHKFMGMSLI